MQNHAKLGFFAAFSSTSAESTSTQLVAFDLAKVQVTVSNFFYHSKLYFHWMNTDELDTSKCLWSNNMPCSEFSVDLSNYKSVSKTFFTFKIN